MSYLDDWKKCPTGWPVKTVKDNTDGVTISDQLSYEDGSPAHVKRGGVIWGTVGHSADDTEVSGQTEHMSFQITCDSSGTLTGELFTAHSTGGHKRGYGDSCEPIPPGSWTATEGG